MEDEFDILEHYQNQAAHFHKKGPIGRYGIARHANNEVSHHLLVGHDDITWRVYPKLSKLSKVEFDEGVNKEKDFDFLTTTLSAHGFFISQKAKDIVEKFDLGDHKFYPAEILLDKGSLFKKKKVLDNYWWLHLLLDEDKLNFVDFGNSIFKETISFQGDILSNKEITFRDLADWKKHKTSTHQKWLESPGTNNFHEIIAWTIALRKDIKLPDLLGFGRIDHNVYFSKALAEAVKSNKLKGVSVSATGKIA